MQNDLDLIWRALEQPAPHSSDYDLNPDINLTPDRRLRPAAVLVGLLPQADGWHVLLTKRSSKLRHHPGQIAFPGGRIDPGDASPEDAAKREAFEEVALDPATVRVMGRLTPHETVTNFDVVPVVAEIRGRFDPVAEVGEVAEIFTVPLTHVINPAHYRIEGRRWQGRRRYYYTVPFGPYYVWGATARMLKGLADRVAACR